MAKKANKEQMVVAMEEQMVAMVANTEEEEKMERANRVAVSTTENGYEARFYRTHKIVGTIEVQLTPNDKGEIPYSNESREYARNWAIGQCPQYGIEWKPEMQEQAWERKYNTYYTVQEIAEDTITLLTPSIERLASKGKFQMEIIEMVVSAVSPKESKLTYVENGRYTKSGAWCTADIEMIITANIQGNEISMVYKLELKSGQICNPKTTIADWNLLVSNEIELNGIQIA